MKRVVAIVGVALAVSTARALPPKVQSITLTDVTPRGFSVVWLATPESSPGLRVFEAPGCDVQVAASVEAWPTVAGGSGVAAAAAGRGVMKARVIGLASDTEYCFQTVTTATGGDTTVAPLEPGRARTARGPLKGREEAGQAGLAPVANDLVRFAVTLSPGSFPSSGLLLLARVEGASAPISAFIGDGIDDDANPQTPTTLVLLDLNNLYAGLSAQTLDLLGDGSEGMTFLELGGPAGVAPVHARVVPADQNLSEIVDSDACPAAALGLACDGLLADPTSDGEFGPDDPAAIASSVVGAASTLACPVCADVDFDGATGMKDALAIAQFLQGLGTLP